VQQRQAAVTQQPPAAEPSFYEQFMKGKVTEDDNQPAQAQDYN